MFQAIRFTFIGAIILLAPLFILKVGKINVEILSKILISEEFLSLFIVYLVAASIGKAGAANATTTILFGQILTAMTIDHLGILGLEKIPWEWNQAVGVILLTMGSYLMLK